VETRAGTAGADVRKALAAELERLVKENVGVTVEVDVVEPEVVDRSQGKAQRLLDLRSP
jgi:phenylacetate-CoA ligase